jgi:sigma-B regulation protein RsbU (phosphoserine phosphatase)
MNNTKIDLSGAKVLVVDDTPANLRLMRQALEPEGYHILIATNGEAAIKTAASALPDLILLDVQMPGIDGFETCRRLKANPTTVDIPVIFVTAQIDTEDVVKGFQVGSIDYIAKPFQAQEVLVRVQTHLKITRLSREVEIAQQRLIDEMGKELRTAHNLQMGLMPAHSPQVEGIDVYGRCLPASEVGGDFFQYFIRDGTLSMCMADVTGHAMEAAIPVVMFDGILDSQVEIGGTLRDMFSSLNRSLCRKLPRHTSVCFVMAKFDISTHTVYLANAGCPYPYHYHASSGEVSECQSEAYPLGASPETEYSMIKTRTKPGDYFVLCSDGIVESENDLGEQFGFTRTADVVQTACSKELDAEATLDQILGELETFSGSTTQIDDVTCVVAKLG